MYVLRIRACAYLGGHYPACHRDPDLIHVSKGFFGGSTEKRLLERKGRSQETGQMALAMPQAEDEGGSVQRGGSGVVEKSHLGLVWKIKPT